MRYETYTIPQLVLKWENQQVVLDCESEPETPAKVLYPKPGETYSDEGAKALFKQVKAHYEERRLDET